MSDYGVQLVYISNASDPVAYNPGTFSAFVLISHLPQYVDIRKTAVQYIDGSTYIFVADGDNGYIIGDVSNPNDPQTIDGDPIDDVVSIHLTSEYAFDLMHHGRTR